MAIGHFCRILAEFSLEYRTTRERILEQNAKKASDKERKQTRGKLIDDVSAFMRLYYCCFSCYVLLAPFDLGNAL